MTHPILSDPNLAYAATTLFALAILHTFCTSYFHRLAKKDTAHSGLWRLLGEVEVVFGLWSAIFLVVVTLSAGGQAALTYLNNQHFTEPLFVFVILTVSATRPILYGVETMLHIITAHLSIPPILTRYFLCLSVLPLLGSLITEPAAMTLAALLLRHFYYTQTLSLRFKYITLAILLVNVSIGGVLTPYAAPPVLMVAHKWGWDLSFMLSTFGWRALLAVSLNAFLATYALKKELLGLALITPPSEKKMPASLIMTHFVFLGVIVWVSHYPTLFLAVFLFFLGVVEAYKRYQTPLMLKEGLLVGFFLAGLIVLGNMQAWWLAPLLSGIPDTALFWGATALTALTDNAALTYLGSLVPHLNKTAQYALVAGAITGGGLTVIANAPNPAAFALLSTHFEGQAISPVKLFIAALLPTLIAAACFMS